MGIRILPDLRGNKRWCVPFNSPKTADPPHKSSLGCSLLFIECIQFSTLISQKVVNINVVSCFKSSLEIMHAYTFPSVRSLANLCLHLVAAPPPQLHYAEIPVSGGSLGTPPSSPLYNLPGLAESPSLGRHDTDSTSLQAL